MPPSTAISSPRMNEESDDAKNSIAHAPRYMTKPALAWIDAAFPERKVAVRADSGHAVLQAVRAGLGIGAVVSWIADRDPHLRRLHDAPATALASIWVLTHASLRSDPTVRSVMAHLSDAITDHRRLLEGRGPDDDLRLDADESWSQAPVHAESP